MIYKKVKISNKGKERIMYFRDGKMISAKDVPQNIIEWPEFGVDIPVADPLIPTEPSLPEEEVQPAHEDPELESVINKTCIFCGEPGRIQRFVHMQTVFLCDEDNKDKTIGVIGARVRELQNAKSKEAQTV